MAQVWRCDRCKTVYDDNVLTDLVIPAVGEHPPRDAVGAAKLLPATEQDRVQWCPPCMDDLQVFASTRG